MKKTYFLMAAWVCMAGGAFATLTTTFTRMGDVDAGSLTNTATVVAGDVVVMFNATNKKPSVQTTTFTTTAPDAFTSLVPWTTGASPNPAGWMSYAAMSTAGTYDFIATTSAGGSTVNGMYLIRATSGSIALLDNSTATYVDGAAYGTPFSVINALGWSSNAAYGEGLVLSIVSDAYGDVSGTVMVDDENNGNRVAARQTIADASATTGFDCVWNISNDSDAEKMRESDGSVVSVAFAEASAAPLPPAFDSDPVVAAEAVQDVAYAGTLADYASDPNGDSMTFSVLPTHTWLSVAANGALSGTPLVGDLGTNQWTVSVADGISGTNSATLEIIVTDSEFYSVPLASSNLYVQGAKFENIDGVGLNFHRLDFGNSYVNVNPVRAKTTTGVKLSFYTRSDTVNLYFDYIPGDENRNSRFGIYQNGTQVDTPYFSNAEANIVITLTSQSAPGELVRHDVVLPNWSNPILTRMELKTGEALEEGNPFPSKQMVVLGDSISHGTGQGSSYQT